MQDTLGRDCMMYRRKTVLEKHRVHC